MSEKPRVSIVAAMSTHDRGIGKDERLLWHIPDDLKHFKELTLGHPIIMGRKTFESIVGYLGGPLPGRTNIVVTRNKDCSFTGAVVCHSLEEALLYAKNIDRKEIFIGGGSAIYEQALPYTDRLYLTLIDEQKEADSFFPEYSDFTKEVVREEREHNNTHYTWLTLERP